MPLLENEAIKKVEERYGSLEEFIAFVITDYPDLFTPKYTPKHREQITGIKAHLLASVKGSVRFRRLASSEIVHQQFDLNREMEHVRVVVEKSVDSLGDVKDVIAAGRYLEERRGTPLNQGERLALPSIVINTGPQLHLYEGDEHATIPTTSYRPKIFGDEPPITVKDRALTSGGPQPFALPEAAELPGSQEVVVRAIGSDFESREDSFTAEPRGSEVEEDGRVYAGRQLKRRGRPRRAASYQLEGVGFEGGGLGIASESGEAKGS